MSTRQRNCKNLKPFTPREKSTSSVVLDNANVHRNAKIRQMHPLWEKQGLFLFYIPPYSPHLNIIETLWRVMKGKSIDSVFYNSEGKQTKYIHKSDGYYYSKNSEYDKYGNLSKEVEYKKME